MTRIKPWHIAQLKAGKQIPLSDHTSKSRLIWALVNNILSGREEFIIKIPHWRTYIIYKGERNEQMVDKPLDERT